MTRSGNCHLAAFPEIVVLTPPVLDPPTAALDPEELYSGRPPS
ncbi:hypothetical protein ACIQHY_31885 [Streptomyces sp. NPDC092359]